MSDAETQFAIAPSEIISMRVFDNWLDIGGGAYVILSK